LNCRGVRGRADPGGKGSVPRSRDRSRRTLGGSR